LEKIPGKTSLQNLPACSPVPYRSPNLRNIQYKNIDCIGYKTFWYRLSWKRFFEKTGATPRLHNQVFQELLEKIPYKHIDCIGYKTFWYRLSWKIFFEKTGATPSLHNQAYQ
jgi:hypothetical protein